MVPLDEICAVLEEILADHGEEMSGANLGNAARMRLGTSVNIKGDFGSLKNFVAQCCGDRIVRVDLDRPDVWFRLVAPSDTVRPSPTAPPAPTTDAWRTFTRFEDRFPLSVHPTSGDVNVRAPGLPLAEGFVDIDTMSEQDHRGIGANFAASLDEPLRADFEAAAASEDYWRRWKRLITRHKGTGVYGKWMAWRHAAISELLAERLTAAGVNSAVLPQAVSTILESKAPANHTSPTTKPTPHAAGSDKAARDLRALAHAAIDAMTDEELRHLSLPLGSVAEAQRRRQ